MITEPITAERAEDLRREVAAMLFFAIPSKAASEAEKFERLQSPIRDLLHIIDILDGKSDLETTTCEGCGKVLTPEMPRLVCADGQDLCAKCAPEDHPATQYGYRADDADRDIASARQWVAELMSEDETRKETA